MFLEFQIKCQIDRSIAQRSKQRTRIELAGRLHKIIQTISGNEEIIQKKHIESCARKRKYNNDDDDDYNGDGKIETDTK